MAVKGSVFTLFSTPPNPHQDHAVEHPKIAVSFCFTSLLLMILKPNSATDLNGSDWGRGKEDSVRRQFR
jgi:hypothetical protein